MGEAAAAAAEEEEGEAAAAKGKRTALPGLGGTPQSRLSPHFSAPAPPFIWKGLCRLARPLRGVRFFLSLFLSSASFLPQWRGREGGPPKSS